jgi:hypothetical protein
MIVDWTVIFSGTVHAVAALELVFWKHLARPVGLAHKGGAWWAKTTSASLWRFSFLCRALLYYYISLLA